MRRVGRRGHFSCARPASVSGVHVAIIGSGPAGLYTADELLRSARAPSRVDIFERGPLPMGLLRYGVAPDHPEVKLVSHKFRNEVLEDPAVRIFGNVEVGRDVTLEQLLKAYDAVFVCHGAAKSRGLALPVLRGDTATGHTADLGTLPGYLSASNVVGWYNGDVKEANRVLHLKYVRAVSIVGAGNVAIDIARLMLANPSSLEQTDITRHALKELRESAVTKVSIVARRDAVHAAFTTKELREIAALPEIKISIDPRHLEFEEPGQKKVIEEKRPLKRFLQLLKDASSVKKPDATKELEFVFCHAPKALVVNTTDGLEALRVVETKMDYASSSEPAVKETNVTKDIPCELVVGSIGYAIQSLDDKIAPTDKNGSCLKNVRGRIAKGLYVTGWAKRGPSGIVPTNKWDAAETVISFLEDNIEHDATKNGFSPAGPSVLTYNDMERIENLEKMRGAGKFVSWDEMRDALKKD